MSSGVTVSVDAKQVYDDVKKNKHHRYIIYSIKEEKVIEVEFKGDRNASYQDFLTQMKDLKDQCRYCLFDFPAEAPQEGTNEPSKIALDRLVLMTWCPEGAKVKQKMLYASSYDALKKALVGVYKYVQACDFEELSQEAIEEALKKK
ncbi:cofilin/actin-depolymerizing factorisoform 1-like [Tropilaelaps mercedesae]|uniref:Cofilin/actin-depolymerizing factorisoform 1-like n=1 Tax=Tropilaelaps mercedesae TaxID=418985 RepID=A0A1V9XYD7_9ACAR|nr:cofilin/actin-depolymerizing factorisoform 1-like [Tropilaelaps mercedesae]